MSAGEKSFFASLTRKFHNRSVKTPVRPAWPRKKTLISSELASTYQLIEAPEARTIGVHFAVSVRMKPANSSGVLGAASSP